MIISNMLPLSYLLVISTIAFIPSLIYAREEFLDGSMEANENEIRARLLQFSPYEPVDLNNFESSSRTPVVFWHGLGDTAFGSINIDRLALMKKFPNITVLSIQIGSDSAQDRLSSYFGDVNSQIESACREIINNEVIKRHGAFNSIGFSQGSQFLRGLIQRCPLEESGIRPKNFISLGGQHQGVFGLPHCDNKLCDYIRYLLTYEAYASTTQEFVVTAQYWHDPTRESVYKERNSFLADINNERHLNETYKKNLLRLDNLVLVEFLEDDMVVPPASSLFGFYEASPHGTDRIVPLESSVLYLEDRLGLRELRDSGRLHKISVHGRHLQYKMSWFLDEIVSVYLDN